MSAGEQTARQRAFYQAREHAHLRPRADDHYAAKVVARMARALDLGPGHRVLELGAGFGRFTFPLLAHCGAVVALDLSPRVLDDLARARDERGIAEARCRTLCADVDALDGAVVGGPVDFVVGFFFLHHLHDAAATLHRLAPLVARPGAGMAFVEPNRWNPLFAAQVACCPDMTWRDEKGMFLLGRRRVERSLRELGFADAGSESFGFFPPPLLNRWAFVRRTEAWLERRRALAPTRPLLLFTART